MGKRRDIQGLRALAVTLVVVFHIWPPVLPGGYIGVDVFFVISGFLITAHLLSEVDRTGTVSVTSFWARRIRRLLPASFLVLAVCVVLAFAVMPQPVLVQNLTEIAAAAAYVVNWLLAINAVDYLAADNPASLVQHFWSLSTEEQFYLVWPLLIVAASFLAVKLFRTRRRTVIAVSLALVFCASLGFSVSETEANQAFAYFITPTRAWEFAAGGIVAMVPNFAVRGRSGVLTHIVLSWAALAVIVGSAFVLDGSSPFPGWIALFPVLATTLLLWLGETDSEWSPQFVSHAGPVQFLGDISYSVYLWHWPLVVITPFLIAGPIGLKKGLVILALTVVLAVATKFFVEDPARNARGRLAMRWPTYGLMAGGMAVLLTVTTASTAVVRLENERYVKEVARAIEDVRGCFGAYAILNDCEHPYRVTSTVNPIVTAADLVRETEIDGGDCSRYSINQRGGYECVWGRLAMGRRSRSSVIRTPVPWCHRSSTRLSFKGGHSAPSSWTVAPPLRRCHRTGSEKSVWYGVTSCTRGSRNSDPS